MTTGLIQTRYQPLSEAQMEDQYRRIPVDNPVISAAAAVTLAARYQATTLGAQLAAFVGGAPVDAGLLLADVLEAYLAATSTEGQHELFALALWTAKHSTGYTDRAETCGHGTWFDSCRETHGQIQGSLPASA